MNSLSGRQNVAALLCLFLCLSACSRATSEETDGPPKQVGRRTGPSDIDPQEIDDTAKFLAGLEGRRDGPYHELEALPAWQTYRANFDDSWTKVQENQFKPIAEFEKNSLEGGKETSRFLFYPFSGPDVLYMTRFFPGRDVYVMAGLEGVGHLPRPGEYTEHNTPNHLSAWSAAMHSIFSRSFFVTSEMSRQLHGDSDGVLPIIALLLTRSGYTVDTIELGQVGKTGTWEKPTAARRRSVRLKFHQGNEPEQTLYYLSTDLAVAFHGENPPLATFLDHLGRPETFIKSASFLPHLVEFTGIRDYVLRASTRIVQDDTGVPYETLIDHGWNVRLYGEYSRPDRPFGHRFQPELQAAFADPGKVEPLGFAIGYGFHRRPSSLLVATPKHE